MDKRFFVCIVIFLLTCPVVNISSWAEESCECVVLLHGLARTHKSMAKLEKDLKKQDFFVVNMPYPSREKTIEILSRETIPAVYEQCRRVDAQKIHFVTHSMGGILVRYYLKHNRLQNLGRVVMLSPPNNGSEVVDKLKNLKLFQWINGPAGNQLGTNKSSIPKSLGEPYYDVGVITGDRSINLFLSLLIPGKDDGKVSVESAKLAGMKDFLVVHKSHPMIMNDKTVRSQVVHFIRHGKFYP